MTGPWRLWERFFFGPRTARVLGLYRIVIGLVTLYSFALFAKDAAVFFSDAGVLTADSLQRYMQRDFHTLLLWVRSPLGVAGVLALLFVAGIFFTIGLWTRLSSVLLFALVVSFHERNNLVLNSGDTVLRCMLFFFLFAPAGVAFSVDSLLRRLGEPGGELSPPDRVAPWAQRMMQLQAAAIYFATAYAKSVGDLWSSGDAMYYVWGLVDFNLYGVEQLMNFPVLYRGLTYSALFAEVALPVLLWFPATRLVGAALGVLLHGYIMVFMTIPVFGILMIATYIPFFSEEELEKALGWARARFAARGARVFFDGACPFCQRARKVVQTLDLFERAEFVNVRQAPPAEWPAGRDRRRLLEEMHLITPEGRVLSGFRAFRWLALRLPATCWLTPVLYFPGVSWIGARVYGWVARNRLIQVSCADPEQCLLHEGSEHLAGRGRLAPSVDDGRALETGVGGDRGPGDV